MLVANVLVRMHFNVLCYCSVILYEVGHIAKIGEMILFISLYSFYYVLYN